MPRANGTGGGNRDMVAKRRIEKENICDALLNTT